MTPKQQAFVIEYLRDFNATQAAIRAGYAKSSARVSGHKNITNYNIASEIKAELEQRIMGADEVLTRVSDIARGSAADYLTIDKHGYAKLDLEKMKNEGKLHLIKKFKVTKGGIEIELYDAQSALYQIGKGHGLWTDQDEMDWRQEIAELLRNNLVTPEQVREEIGIDLATELFKSQGISAITD